MTATLYIQRSFVQAVLVLTRLVGMLAAQARAEDVSRGYSSAVRAVTQAGGGLRIESVSGDSLTFRVYVPHVAGDVAHVAGAVAHVASDVQ